MTPDQAAALAAYLTEWADILGLPSFHLWIGYTDTGPTLDLHAEDHPQPVTRWLLEGNTGGQR